MGFAILPHTEIVNYTKGLMLLHVPRRVALYFMMTTVKTRPVLKWSWSLPPSLQFYLSSPFKQGTKACSRVLHLTSQPTSGNCRSLWTYKYKTNCFIIISMGCKLLKYFLFYCPCSFWNSCDLCPIVVSAAPSVACSKYTPAFLWFTVETRPCNRYGERQRVCFWLLNPASFSGHTSSSAKSPSGHRPSCSSGPLWGGRQGQWHPQLSSPAQEIPLGPRWQIVLVWPHERMGIAVIAYFPLIAFVTCGVRCSGTRSGALLSDVLN